MPPSPARRSVRERCAGSAGVIQGADDRSGASAPRTAQSIGGSRGACACCAGSAAAYGCSSGAEAPSLEPPPLFIPLLCRWNGCI